MVQRLNRNRVCEVVIPHDPWILPPHSPEGPLTIMGPGIGPWLGKINRTLE